MSAMEEGYRHFYAAIPVATSHELEMVDITDALHGAIRESGVRSGLANLFVAGSTAGITTLEYEPGAVADLEAAIRRLAPDDLHYSHNERWGDGNGRSHVRAALLGPSLTVPVREGAPVLGTWQQVIFVELDVRGRNRTVHASVAGSGQAGEV